MRRGGKTSGKTTRLRKAASRKRPVVPASKAARSGGDSNLRRELEHKTRLLNAVLEQQAATSEVLKVISSSTFDLQAVLDTLVESAARLCRSERSAIRLLKDGLYHNVSSHGIPPAHKARMEREPIKAGQASIAGRAALARKSVHIFDAMADSDPEVANRSRLGKVRTFLAVPLLREGTPIGVLLLQRSVVQAFTDKEIALAETFADQAVIAIENVRLFEAENQRTAELSEALEQQTATAEVLRVISSSPGELEPIFQSILANATRICEAKFGALSLNEGEANRVVAMHNAPPAYAELRRREPTWKPTGLMGQVSEQAVASKRAVQIADLAEGIYKNDPLCRTFTTTTQARSFVIVPLLKENAAVGVMAIYRQEVRPFSDKQVELLTNFAAQAVIAIENTRLLSELRESLDRQTATADVLRAISSSPGELEPVFQAMLENATRICGAQFGVLFRSAGGLFEYAAQVGTPQVLAEFLVRRGPFRPAPGTQLNKVMQTRQVSHTADYAADAPDSPPAKLGGARSTLDVPMLKNGKLVGAISVYRQEVQPFSDKQIELLRNFAAQAVIAIENTRLLSELRQSLEQQTATADVLRVISSSPGELEPVFQAMLENATRICDAAFGCMFRFKNNAPQMVANIGFSGQFSEFLRNNARQPGPNHPFTRLINTKQTQHIPDYRLDAAYLEDDPLAKAGVEIGGVRTLLLVPMLKDAVLIGYIGIFRKEVRPFSDKQIELVTNFASQAVIAIENTRLLNELRESLEQQTATADVLRVISSSPGELEPVFGAMLENATRICGAKFGNLWLRERDNFRIAATYGAPPEYRDYLHSEPVIFDPDEESAMGQAAGRRQVIQIEDITKLPTKGSTGAMRTATIELAKARTLVAVPMLKENELVGIIAIYRQEVSPFTDKQIDLVKNFAAQAVIAIENTRLLSELRESLEQQTATSEVLSVISSSPGELEPVFGAMLENATRICGAAFGNLLLYDGSVFRSLGNAWGSAGVE